MKKKRRNLNKGKWCQRWFLERKRLGSHVTILKELQKGSEKDLKGYIRMDPNTFHKLLEKVTPFIAKNDTNMRESVTPEARLEATLIFLSSGCSYTFLQYVTRISKQCLSKIIPETCKAIYGVLRKDYLQVTS